ncbi:olfactory receptor 5V1-like [Bombina bombina]|uniref:olfactory receptor 5V1-like n=1 Tax=Bombina bombina TaxID=8345 RepID=UPI00235A5E93|nr:olfactory receptor 5V1-like [Bombina bombina]
MEKENLTEITEFILEGLSEIPEICYLLFGLFLCIYLITVLGNLIIILAIRFSPSLQTPMYFFLSNFSLLDTSYISVTVPKMLANMVAEKKTISFYNCVIQLYCTVLFGATECFMLTAMAYDRYNAICQPLLYTIIMNKRQCNQLLSESWILGIVNAIIQTTLTFTLPFCGSNKINQFFCDIPPLLKLASTDTWINEFFLFSVGTCLIGTSVILITISYTHIIFTILNICSTSGRKKTFSTCASHFTVVLVYYGSISFMYLRPKSSYKIDQDRRISVMYTVVAPFLNPFIYSLRNHDLKLAVRKIITRIKIDK